MASASPINHAGHGWTWQPHADAVAVGHLGAMHSLYSDETHTSESGDSHKSSGQRCCCVGVCREHYVSTRQ
eukprot:1678679-Prymnesium_polylepis.1